MSHEVDVCSMKVKVVFLLTTFFFQHIQYMAL